MKPVKITPTHPTADLAAFRNAIRTLHGDARCRPHDCTGYRFLIRDTFAARFSHLAAAHGFTVHPDTRAPFPERQ